MQLITFLSAAAATVATVSAKSAADLHSEFSSSSPYARIINRCDYPVNIWSVVKGKVGCPKDGMVTLKKGEIYNENYQTPEGGDQGVSIKISKTDDCKGSDIVQLEYFLEKRPEMKPYWGNYLDVSYVDCLDGDCPTKNEGYYLAAGSSTARAAKASADGSWCPVLSCSDAASCAKMSYILPDDVQTKTCDLDSSMDFYMCGSKPPSDDEEEEEEEEEPASSAPASSSKQAESSAAPKPTTLQAVVSNVVNKNVAAVTHAPEIKESPKVMTKVVYVTAYETQVAKRHEHAHAHARRHQPFHA